MKRSLSIFAFLICSVSGFCADSPAPLKLLATIPLPGITGRIDHLTIDLQHEIAFVSALGANTIVAVDIRHGKVIGSIAGLDEPQGLLYVPENGRLYIANGGDGSVRIYNASTLKPLKTISLADDADNIRYDTAQHTVWVGYGRGALAALDLDGKKLFDIRVSEHPESFALESRGNRIYVNVPRTKQVAVVDRSARKVVASFGTGLTLENYPMALDEADSRIFIGCRLPARLLVLDTASGKSVASLGTAGTTDDLFYDAARHRIYVLGGDGYVVTYSQSDANTYSEISRIGTGPGGRTGLFIPELSQLLVATPRNDSEDAAVQVYQVQ
jgi:DNA-binding beta-propeller fold protein YncE